MRVVMMSPYSLSRPGGVQGQVLGLARELRKLGVDVRVVGPCDGPPPEPGVVSVGPERRVGLQRLGRADLARRGDRAPHRARCCGASSPTSCTCTSPRCPVRRSAR